MQPAAGRLHDRAIPHNLTFSSSIPTHSHPTVNQLHGPGYTMARQGQGIWQVDADTPIHPWWIFCEC